VGEPLKQLAESTYRFLIHHEGEVGARKRSRNRVAAAQHRRQVDVVVANLARAVLDPPETGRIAVRASQGERGLTRYDNPALGPKPLRATLGHLLNLDFIDWSMPAAARGERASIAPSDWFGRKVREADVGLQDIGWDPRGEVILLSRNTRRTGAEWGARQGTIQREPVNYRDTPQTRRLREQMRRINAWLMEADIGFVDDGLAPPVLSAQRVLRRHFVLRADQTEPRFDQSGRLFGGFWETLKSHRRGQARIGGEPLAVLDYGSMFTRLAYAELGAEAPAGDLYAVAGAEGYRSGIKMAMNCLLFDAHTRREWPDALGVGVGDDAAAKAGTSPAADFDARLPQGWTVGRTKKAILAHQPVLQKAFGRGLGYRLMHHESEVLIAVLEELMGRGVVALGLHDGVLVAVSRAEEAKEVMEAKAVDVVGVAIPVSVRPA
jgi:hypothetical protein